MKWNIKWNNKWMLAGAMALAMALMPALLRADEHPVNYDDLPRPVKHALDVERHDHKISQLWDVHHGDRHFYRAIVEMDDGEHVIRVNEHGDIISLDTLGPEEHEWDTNWHHANEGVIVSDRDVPHEVKHVIDHEIAHGHVKEVRLFTFDELPVYQVVVESRSGTRFLEILPDGTFYGEGEDIRHGLHAVNMDDLPRPARDAIRHEAGRVPVVKVYATHAHGQDIYTAVAYEGHGDHRYVTVNEHGDVIREADTH